MLASRQKTLGNPTDTRMPTGIYCMIEYNGKWIIWFRCFLTPREYANKRRRMNGRLIPFRRWKDLRLEQEKIKEERGVEEPLELNESNAHDTSISSTVLDEIMKSCNGDDMRAFEVLLGDEDDKEDRVQVPAKAPFPLEKTRMPYES